MKTKLLINFILIYKYFNHQSIRFNSIEDTIDTIDTMYKCTKKNFVEVTEP